MRTVLPLRCLHPLILVLALLLSSCGGGSNTAGAGGSGVGGTGITTVTGNVSQIVARAEDPALSRRLFAAVTRFISSAANAQSDTQSDTLGDIVVFGGGQITTTDESGNFTLEDVDPSQNFILNFTLSNDQTIALPIGEVPAGTNVRVINVMIDSGQGFASAEDVEVESNGSSNAGGNPGNSPGFGPGNNPGNNPGNPGFNPGNNPGNNPGFNPGNNPGNNGDMGSG